MLTHHSVAPASNIPLLAEEGWRDSRREARARQGEASRKADAPGWREARARQGEAPIEDRRDASAELTTPSAPSLRSAQPPLLCEEGNNPCLSSIFTSPLPA